MLPSRRIAELRPVDDPALLRWLAASVYSRIAAVTTLLLTTFIAIRAASIHIIDEWDVVKARGIRAGWWSNLQLFLCSLRQQGTSWT